MLLLFWIVCNFLSHPCHRVWSLEECLEISRLRSEPGASLSENTNSSWQLCRKVYITTGSAEAQKGWLPAPLLLVRLGLPTPVLWLPELQGAWEMSPFNPTGSSEWSFRAFPFPPLAYKPHEITGASEATVDSEGFWGWKSYSGDGGFWAPNPLAQFSNHPRTRHQFSLTWS